MVQVKAKYTNVPVQTDVGRSQQTQDAKRENSPKPPAHRKTRQTQPNKNQATPTNQTKTTKEGEPKTPTRTTDNEAGRQDQPKRGRGGKKASGDQQTRKERTPGKAAEAGGRMQHKPRWARTALVASKGILDHPRANTSVPQRRAHEQHPQHGGESKAPHRAEAFVAMKQREDTSH